MTKNNESLGKIPKLIGGGALAPPTSSDTQKLGISKIYSPGKKAETLIRIIDRNSTTKRKRNLQNPKVRKCGKNKLHWKKIPHYTQKLKNSS